MLFSSLTFISFFLPVFLILYFAVRSLKAKNTVLFFMSLLFYAWGEPVYVLLMILVLILNYYSGRLIALKDGREKLWLSVTVFTDIAVLFLYKYSDFLIETVNRVFKVGLPLPKVSLPIGISFYTFQILSYVIDVYRGDTKAQKSLITLGAYLCAFPQLIAGPIVRYTDVEKELADRKSGISDIKEGVRRFILGLSKKVLIANTMAMVADSLFSLNSSALGFFGTWIAAISYTLQIYYDFSGYSDMAIGLGRIMGFHFPENFKNPYSAVSVKDFWRRWHITLSGFFRDYVYIPLGGSRVSVSRWVINMLLVWCLTGVWHGAGFTFIAWGIYYGTLLVLEKLLFSKFAEKHKILSRIHTCLFFIFGWVVFRADSIKTAWDFYKGMTGFSGFAPEKIHSTLMQSGVSTVFTVTALLGIIFAFPNSKLKEKWNGLWKGIPADCVLILLFVLCYIILASGAYNPFIYFRF